jgi:SET domain
MSETEQLRYISTIFISSIVVAVAALSLSRTHYGDNILLQPTLYDGDSQNILSPMVQNILSPLNVNDTQEVMNNTTTNINASMCYIDYSNKSMQDDEVLSSSILQPYDVSVNTDNVRESRDGVKSEAPKPKGDSDVCRIYVAPSTIPGAGIGIFAGVSFNRGDLVTPGDGVVPIYNPVFNNGNQEHINTLLWDEYVWSASTFTAMEIPDQGMEGASFGIGALPNCFFALLNVEDSEDHKRDNANLEAINSPGVGAFSPWYDRKSYATKDIQAGSELYVDYGYGYFNSRTETIGYIPFLDDFDTADNLLHKFQNLTNNSIMNDEMSDSLFHLSRSILDMSPNRVLLALPEERSEIANILQNGGSIQKDYLRSIQSIDYLKTHGACMDHLYVATSFLPHAGRGVFTSRSFTKGSVVTTVPLIHIPERKVMTIYGEAKYDSGYNLEEPMRNISNPIHEQLLVNYCFGHKQSTLLLCPYGIVSSLINHASTASHGISNVDRQQHTPAANVQIQWSHKMSKSPSWWNVTIAQWAYTYQAGLAFEYIALRDIEADEEITIDYGTEWQIAWEKHVANWRAVPRLVDALNDDIDSIIPTNEEWVWHGGDVNVNPEAVNLWCYDVYRKMQGLPATDLEAYHCNVVQRRYDTSTASYVYIAEIRMRRQNKGYTKCDEIFDEVLWSLPRDAFVYGGYNDIYDTNQYLMPSTFRHEIGIPDDLMPPMWRNIPPKTVIN